MFNEDICSKIILPFCPGYDRKRQIFNRSIQKYPSAIVYCENVQDVKEAVRYAVSRRMEIRVRSGGHNYEGFCIGNNRLVIDTSLLKDKSICEETQTVRIGSGVNNRELYHFLSQYGYPFPSGTCPTVKAVGLTQGGGWGHSSRMFGLTCDLLAEAELVDPKGNVIVANQREHSDLFWALRGGGGGNFGVITSLTYHLLPKVTKVTYVDIQYSDINDETALQFLQTWQKWVQKKENRFTPNSRIFNSQKEGMGIFLRGFFYGTPEEATASVQPFLKICGAKASFRYVTFLEATEIDASVYPPFEKFRFAGRFVCGSYSIRQIEAIIRMVKKRARGSTYASVALYALGGRVRDMAPCDTAFYYRKANYIMGIETIWKVPEAQPENLSWIHSRFRCLSSLTVGSYINFPYLCTPHYMKAYYGGNAKRLMCIKDKYDPCNLFRFAQSIKPCRASKVSKRVKDVN